MQSPSTFPNVLRELTRTHQTSKRLTRLYCGCVEVSRQRVAMQAESFQPKRMAGAPKLKLSANIIKKRVPPKMAETDVRRII